MTRYFEARNGIILDEEGNPVPRSVLEEQQGVEVVRAEAEDNELKESYAEKELSYLNVSAGPISVKLTDFDGNSTKNFNLNPESVRALEAFLQNFK